MNEAKASTTFSKTAVRAWTPSMPDGSNSASASESSERIGGFGSLKTTFMDDA